MKELTCLSAIGFLTIFGIAALGAWYMTCCNPDLQMAKTAKIIYVPMPSELAK